MSDLSKILPATLEELGNMDYLNLLIICATLVCCAALWKLPEIIRAKRGK